MQHAALIVRWWPVSLEVSAVVSLTKVSAYSKRKCDEAIKTVGISPWFF